MNAPKAAWPTRGRFLRAALGAVVLATLPSMLTGALLFPGSSLALVPVVSALGAAVGCVVAVAWGARGLEPLRRAVSRQEADPMAPPPSGSLVSDVMRLPWACAWGAGLGAFVAGVVALVENASSGNVVTLGLVGLAPCFATPVSVSLSAHEQRARAAAHVDPRHVLSPPKRDVAAFRVESTTAFVGIHVALLAGAFVAPRNPVGALLLALVGMVMAVAGATYFGRLTRAWDDDLADLNNELDRFEGVAWPHASPGSEGGPFDAEISGADIPLPELADVSRVSVGNTIEPQQLRTLRGTMLQHEVVGLYQRFVELAAAESQARGAVADAQRLKSRFMAYMSHDLRSPLNAIIGFSDLLDVSGEPLNVEQRESLGTIRRAADELLRIIAEVLDSARLDAGRLSVELDYAAAAPLMSAAVARATRGADSLGVSFDPETEAGLPAVFVDQARTQQALVALLLHVAHNCRRGERVGVRVRATQTEAGAAAVAIEVEAAQMLLPESRADVFEPFVWRDPSSDLHRRGLGFGLALARGLVRAQDGDITFTPLPQNRGARFQVLLPTSPSTAGHVW